MHGIGGRTIAEAKQTISYEEFLSWVAYRKKYGSLHFGMRTEESMALLATIYANSKSKKTFHIHDFSPHTENPEDKPLTFKELEDF